MTYFVESAISTIMLAYDNKLAGMASDYYNL